MHPTFRPVFGSGQVQLRSTLKPVTPFGGLVSLIEFFGRIGLAAKLEEAMVFKLRSPNAIPPAQTLIGFIFAVIAGASRFAHTDWLRSDKALQAMLGIGRFPGTDTVRNFFARFSQSAVEAFWRPLWRWLLPHFVAPAEGFSLDLDSTIFQRSGSQQGAARGYNPQRPGRNSHHPLLAVLAEAPCILHAWLRSGNTGASRGISEFLKEALALLPAGWKLRTVRADSGFFAQELMEFLEAQGLGYAIVARAPSISKRWLRAASEYPARFELCPLLPARQGSRALFAGLAIDSPAAPRHLPERLGDRSPMPVPCLLQSPCYRGHGECLRRGELIFRYSVPRPGDFDLEIMAKSRARR